MKPRAFVVMPFGKKPLLAAAPQKPAGKAKQTETLIDFDSIYNDLLYPALYKAGCDPFRADFEQAAGDIRTDMFFELVTADLVVADVSIPNPNVYYELGVRDGVSPSGIFIVHGRFLNTLPFDVASDRCFYYDGELFMGASQTQDNAARLSEEVTRLSRTFRDALSRERESVDSPVYQHLPKLQKVNWENIETPKSNYFGAIGADWRHRVQIARAELRPGDIKTLADYASSRTNRTKILYEAALALMDLCRYSAAERELREVVELDPDHFDAQVQLGRTLIHQGKTEEAREHIKDVQMRFGRNPEAADILAQGARFLWHLNWRDDPDKTESRCRALALENARTAGEAIRNFLKSHNIDSRNYYAGFNALILHAILQQLTQQAESTLPDEWPLDEKTFQQLLTVVEFSAREARRKAVEEDDGNEEFRAKTALSGIALMRADGATALRLIVDACHIQNSTVLQLHTFHERISLLDDLGVWKETISQAIAVVAGTLAKRIRASEYRVVLWGGYGLDKADGTEPRFPKSSIEEVTKQIEKALDDWAIGPPDLAICEGIYESDILFAEACSRRGAAVRLMWLEPQEDDATVTWPFDNEEWSTRLKKLRSQETVVVWSHAQYLGSIPNQETPDGKRSLAQRHKSWMLNTAVLAAAPTQDPWHKPVSNFADRLFGLFLCNQHDSPADDPWHPAYLIPLVNRFYGHQGFVRVIRAIEAPAPPSNTSAAKA